MYISIVLRIYDYINKCRIRFLHWPKNTLNLCRKNRACYGWSRCNPICLIFRPDICQESRCIRSAWFLDQIDVKKAVVSAPLDFWARYMSRKPLYPLCLIFGPGICQESHCIRSALFLGHILYMSRKPLYQLRLVFSLQCLKNNPILRTKTGPATAGVAATVHVWF